MRFHEMEAFGPNTDIMTGLMEKPRLPQAQARKYPSWKAGSPGSKA